MDSTQDERKEVIFFRNDIKTTLFTVHIVLFGVIIAVTIGTVINIEKQYWPIMAGLVFLIFLTDCFVFYFMEKVEKNRKE